MVRSYATTNPSTHSRSASRKQETETLAELDNALREFIDKHSLSVLLGAIALGFVFARLR